MVLVGQVASASAAAASAAAEEEEAAVSEASEAWLFLLSNRPCLPVMAVLLSPLRLARMALAAVGGATPAVATMIRGILNSRATAVVAVELTTIPRQIVLVLTMVEVVGPWMVAAAVAVVNRRAPATILRQVTPLRTVLLLVMVAMVLTLVLLKMLTMVHLLSRGNSKWCQISLYQGCF